MRLLISRLILLLLKFPGKKVCNEILCTLDLYKPSLSVPFSQSTNFLQCICNIEVRDRGAIFFCYSQGSCVRLPEENNHIHRLWL